MAESSLFSAGGHLPLTQAVPGNLRTGPGGHAGPLYGRTEHGRSRGARGRSPVVGKGLHAASPPQPNLPQNEKAWFRLVIALLCAASFVVSAALLDEEVTSVRRARG